MVKKEQIAQIYNDFQEIVNKKDILGILLYKLELFSEDKTNLRPVVKSLRFTINRNNNER